MHILIFGATGVTGRQLVRQALDRDHQVTAFVRNPVKLPLRHPLLRVVQGDVQRAETIHAQVWIWSLATGERAAVLAGHRRKVSGVAFSPDGRSLASAASDSTVRLWQRPPTHVSGLERLTWLQGCWEAIRGVSSFHTGAPAARKSS